MKFSFAKLAWSPELFDRLQKSISDAVQKHDYDSGWVKTPSNKVFTHKLGVLPVEVFVQMSDNSDGDSFQVDTYSAVTRQTITVGGTKKYSRVLINV